jgi:hypothetical protein
MRIQIQLVTLMRIQIRILKAKNFGKVSDPDPAYHFDVDPDPDPDPTFQFDADSDPQTKLILFLTGQG